MGKSSTSSQPQKSSTKCRLRLIPTTPRPEGTTPSTAQPVQIPNVGTSRLPETSTGNLYSDIIREQQESPFPPLFSSLLPRQGRRNLDLRRSLRCWSFCCTPRGNISAFLILLSPIGTFARIVKKRSTEDFSSFPYICMVLNASLWTYYGIIKPDALLVATVNGSGIIISTVYLFLYLAFAPAKIRARTAVMDVGFVVVAIWVSRFELEGESSINFTGFLCACFNILRYASPLSIMRQVVITKSEEYMPLLLSICLCANGLT
ncbi:bidirectional sugar transporter SWEET17-like [Salvia splendens]|uniref:bidirectional sugar transporter SWEET17-like n=1 Tax=Salvia splendens TaxID=180675 RepID=UPI001C2627FB|nr:bidirectional sugar transporter SWEET17-like [Salvia splendens]